MFRKKNQRRKQLLPSLIPLVKIVVEIYLIMLYNICPTKNIFEEL